jgi:alpha-galactosidase
MQTRIRFVLPAVLAVLVARLAEAVSPTPAEMAEARRWVVAAFEGVEDAKTPEVGLQVLANNDAVQPNARGGRPLKIGDKQYTRGLYCHAVSKVVVRLPGPGKKFTAVAGIDSNEQTSPGRGSVVFSVTIGGKSVFQSPIMREGMPGVPVQVDLGGAKEFLIEVSDGGDGISCDQADWADAQVVLADGRSVWLGDLPIVGARRTYSAGPFFSFTYGGKPSAELLPTWDCKRTKRALDDQRTEHTIVYTDPKTGLVLRCVGVEYRDFPTVEWTLYFKNPSDKDTPILADIRALDTRLPSLGQEEFRLHHHVGSICAPNDYQPLETVLAPGATKRISGAGGRPTNSDLSYFNVQMPGKEGLIVVVGWPGQWAGEFARDKENRLHVWAGQELTHFKLLPGEEVRTPMIVFQFWKGDRIHAQNVWRRWMMAHSMPKPGGKLPPPQFVASSSRAYEEMIGANEQNQIMHIDRYLEEGIKLDYWWMDAGWYIQQHGWPQVGTWEVDPKRFPKGLRPISDHAHSKGVKILVWFEPERVAAGTWLADNHPEWILGGKGGGLLNLGNPDAWKWLVNHIDKLISEQGIDLYRQDFNMDPLNHWRGADAPDRQGITEIKHVTGYLAYWDELRRRHPNMLIDCCASGGRRNDLETLRRAVPLWRSDFPFEPNSQQCQTFGLSSWIPYHGTGTVACSSAAYYGGGKTPVEPYAFWSNSAPSLGSGIDVRVKDLDYPTLRRLLEQRRQTAPFYYGDFYPLMPYSLERGVWMAWQFDRPESGDGMVQVFRRAESPYESIRVKLGGLDANAAYVVTNLDEPNAAAEMTGKQLMEGGLAIAVKDCPGAAVIVYTKKS